MFSSLDEKTPKPPEDVPSRLICLVTSRAFKLIDLNVQRPLTSFVCTLRSGGRAMCQLSRKTSLVFPRIWKPRLMILGITCIVWEGTPQPCRMMTWVWASSYLHMSFGGLAHATAKDGFWNSPANALSLTLYNESWCRPKDFTISHHLEIIDHDSPVQC